MGRFRKRLAKKLRKLRGERSHREFARILGISKSSLHRIEMGDQNVAIDTLETLCTRLKCEIGDLFDADL